MTEEMNQKKQKQGSALALRLKELGDKRQQFENNNEIMNKKIEAYKIHLIEEQKREQELQELIAKEEAERLALEATKNRYRRMRHTSDRDPPN